jgi:hypothetical protein
MREHLDKIRKGDKSQLLYRHFNSDDLHRDCPLEERVGFQIIEKICVEDGPPVEVNLMRKRRTEREMFWISKLRTPFPLGLNDKMEGFGILGMATDSSFGDYNPMRIENLFEGGHSKRPSRHGRKTRAKITEEDMVDFRDRLGRIMTEGPAKMEAHIRGKSRKFLSRFRASGHYDLLDRKVRYILDKYVRYSAKVPNRKQEDGQIKWMVDLSHKIIDEANLNGVMNCPQVRRQVPGGLRYGKNPQVVFKFSGTIARKILNYNKILKNTGVLSYQDIVGMDCRCENHPLKHDVFGHVITGDLSVLHNEKLREICSKGAKFREVPYLDVKKVMLQIKGDIAGIGKKWAGKNKIAGKELKGWMDAMYEECSDRIGRLAKVRKYDRPVLSDRACKRELGQLQEDFVITVVDKAANNFAFICKKLYFLKLAEELGLERDNPGNDTYTFINETEGDICREICSYLVKYKITPKIEEAKLAVLYQTPKFHKDPPKCDI